MATSGHSDDGIAGTGLSFFKGEALIFKGGWMLTAEWVIMNFKSGLHKEPTKLSALHAGLTRFEKVPKP